MKPVPEGKIEHLLTHGVEEVFVRESLLKKLHSGKKLRVKLGFDPTSPKIHLGRSIILWKLKEFQELGHTPVFIVGDFTARIGDPSDKLEKRPMLSSAEIKKNIKTYRAQVGKILDLEHAEFVYNSKWLSKLRFEEIIELAECFSVQQMSHRRNFADRIERGEEISLREFLYPLMQGYDSVAVSADMEIGGFDQLFNLKAGRVIQRHYRKTEQDVLTTEMLPGTDGRKMSSSWGNVINISDPPGEMFGEIMSLNDELIPKYFRLCARVSDEEVRGVEKELSSGANPRDLKLRLARRIVALYHGEKKAGSAEADFIGTFREGGIPNGVKIILTEAGMPFSEVLTANGIVSSKSEWRRLVSGGAVEEIGGGKITDPSARAEAGERTFRVGKKRFVKIRAKN